MEITQSLCDERIKKFQSYRWKFGGSSPFRVLCRIMGRGDHVELTPFSTLGFVLHDHPYRQIHQNHHHGNVLNDVVFSLSSSPFKIRMEITQSLCDERIKKFQSYRWKFGGSSPFRALCRIMGMG
jgi:hypothetical protein